MKKITSMILDIVPYNFCLFYFLIKKFKKESFRENLFQKTSVCDFFDQKVKKNHSEILVSKNFSLRKFCFQLHYSK